MSFYPFRVWICISMMTMVLGTFSFGQLDLLICEVLEKSLNHFLKFGCLTGFIFISRNLLYILGTCCLLYTQALQIYSFQMAYLLTLYFFLISEGLIFNEVLSSSFFFYG